MTDMFKHYPQPDDYKPDNYPKCHHKHELTIMAGENTSHTFEVPFNVETDTLDYDILYQLGVTLLITKNKRYCETIVDEDKYHPTTFITCSLSSSETLLFANTAREARVQIRFRMKDLSTVYTEIYTIKLMDSLDASEEQPPVPHIISGIGYTED